MIAFLYICIYVCLFVFVYVYPISDACGCLVPGSLRGSSLESSVFSSPVTEGSVVYSRAR